MRKKEIERTREKEREGGRGERGRARETFVLRTLPLAPFKTLGNRER